MKKFLFSPKGRVTLGQFWLYVASMMCAAFVLGRLPILLQQWLHLPDGMMVLVGTLLSFCFLILFVYSFIIQLIKRAHDLGKKGSYVWYCLIPFYGLIVSVYLMCEQGDGAQNEYGDVPGILKN